MRDESGDVGRNGVVLAEVFARQVAASDAPADVTARAHGCELAGDVQVLGVADEAALLEVRPHELPLERVGVFELEDGHRGVLVAAAGQQAQVHRARVVHPGQARHVALLRHQLTRCADARPAGAEAHAIEHVEVAEALDEHRLGRRQVGQRWRRGEEGVARRVEQADREGGKDPDPPRQAAAGGRRLGHARRSCGRGPTPWYPSGT